MVYNANMPLSIKSLETERLARAVASRTGESLTGAIQKSLAERLERLKKQSHNDLVRGQLQEIL
jgi:antitoxin VapB